MAADEVRAFYAKHCASGGVVIVQVLDGSGGLDDMAVFSSLDNAHAWADGLWRSEHDDRRCLFIPYVIDVPEHGNLDPHQVN